MTANRAALVFGTITCLLWALVPTLVFPNPPLDVVEGFAWGRELALGYTKHPPMQAWLLELSYQLTGGRAFGGYWLSAFCVGLGYWAIWALAKRLELSAWGAFWSMALTSATFYFTLPVPEFNPNILQIPIWAAMIFLFHRALGEGRLSDWILLGLLAAFGLYTKYFVALLIGSVGLYTLAFVDARRHLLTAGPWLAATVCTLAFLPHLIWLLDTSFLTFRYAASRSNPAEDLLDHVYNPLNFLAAQLGNHAGLFVAVLSGLGLQTARTWQKPDLSLNRLTSDTRFLVWFSCVPLMVVLVLSALTGNEFKHMWGTPMFVLSGLLAVRLLDLPATWVSWRRPLAVVVAIQLVFLAIVAGQGALEPLWKTKHTRVHYPGTDIAEFLTGEWKHRTGTDLAFVAGEMWPTANVTLHASHRPTMFLDHDLALSPWIDFSMVQASGVMLVWQGESETVPPGLAGYYPGAHRDGSRVFEFYGDGKIPSVTINWLIVPAGKVAVRP